MHFDEVAPSALTVSQSARYIAVSERQFHALRRRADFPDGRQYEGTSQVRFLKCDLDAWLAAQPKARKREEPEQLAASRSKPAMTCAQRGNNE